MAYQIETQVLIMGGGPVGLSSAWIWPSAASAPSVPRCAIRANHQA